MRATWTAVHANRVARNDADRGDDWRDHAACAGMDPEIWYPYHPEETGQNGAALAVCNRCPVATECLRDELQHPKSQQWGIRGGFTEEQRRRIKRRHERRHERRGGAA